MEALPCWERQSIIIFASVASLSWNLCFLELEGGSKVRGYMYCCCCSVTKSCLPLCNPTDCSTSGFPVLHHLPELAQTHVHWVGDAIQPSHPLLSPSPPALQRERERERERFIIGTGFHDDGSWEATWSALCKLKNQESCWYHNWYNYNAVPRSVNQEHQCLRAEEKEIEFSLPLPFGFVGAHWIGWCLLALGRVIIFLYSVYRFKCQPLPDTFLQTNPEIMF